jgi:hypothetical protein
MMNLTMEAKLVLLDLLYIIYQVSYKSDHSTAIVSTHYTSDFSSAVVISRYISNILLV